MERKPILLSKNICALIWIFDRTDELFDICAGGYEKYNDSEVSKEAAKEFVKQLKGRWNGIFMEALKKEINLELKKYRNIGKAKGGK